MAWDKPDLAGPAGEGFSDPHPVGRHVCPVRTQRASFGLQFVKKKKQQKTNFIKTENFFSFQIVNLSINVTHVVV